MTTYIKLEYIQEMFLHITTDSQYGNFVKSVILEKINYLPYIEPESMIEEMMETRNDCNDDFQK